MDARQQIILLTKLHTQKSNSPTMLKIQKALQRLMRQRYVSKNVSGQSKPLNTSEKVVMLRIVKFQTMIWSTSITFRVMMGLSIVARL